MNIKENNNFKEVKLSEKNITIEELLEESLTKHLNNSRKKRFDMAVNLNKHKDGSNAEVDKIFFVDKGHKDGPELHCVTKKGIIFILNERKYENNDRSFITVLLARPNQVIRLYEECNLEIPKSIINGAKKNLKNKINK
jgi:hypothetical protein